MLLACAWGKYPIPFCFGDHSVQRVRLNLLLLASPPVVESGSKIARMLSLLVELRLICRLDTADVSCTCRRLDGLRFEVCPEVFALCRTA